ncbi:hypothetical protein [Leptolyngbya sp. 7M]|uniref:hypothetical protein n=1 Tax=Leptolyngbya sp. 7M TaxID=2812896 RepID=UPI001B8AA74D|nr:hypothetical protein [Leptolyngbya sp. 7M]QYO64400.1 hypothetical protein JVX88_32735 [Leptolyngbya sp. 7M]
MRIFAVPLPLMLKSVDVVSLEKFAVPAISANPASPERIAYGADETNCRGVSVTKGSAEPAGLTEISSQRSAKLGNDVLSTSISTVNMPLTA